MTEKKCSKCGEVKDINEFYQRNGKPVRSECKPCSRAMCRSYKARNRGKIAAYNKEYKAEHADEISVYNHDYNIEHREEIQKRQTKQHRERKKVDKNYALSCELRGKLYHFIKYGGCSTLLEDLTGCDYNSIRFWFEFQFDEKMDWDNHGTYWSIDHVDPCCNFDLTIEENQYICFHWSNLRPSVKLKNQKKTGKVIPEEIAAHQKIVKKFLKFLPKDKEYKNAYPLIEV